MNFTEKINALIWEIEHELGVDRGFPVTLELAKASLAARKLEAEVKPMERVAEFLEARG